MNLQESLCKAFGHNLRVSNPWECDRCEGPIPFEDGIEFFDSLLRELLDECDPNRKGKYKYKRKGGSK